MGKLIREDGDDGIAGHLVVGLTEIHSHTENSREVISIIVEMFEDEIGKAFGYKISDAFY